MTLQQQCPCGTGRTYDACCGRLHRGEVEASTAVELMRARYSAYAVGNADYVFRTWHPRTRPVDLALDAMTTWTGLTVLDVVGGGERDDSGEVRFVAAFAGGELSERSRFVRRGRRWVYLDGDVDP